MNKKVIVILVAICIIGAITIPAFISENDSSKSNTKSDFKIKIESGGTWRLDLIVDGHHSLIEGNGSRTINLGNIDSASITFNQYKGGPSTISLLDGDNTVINRGRAPNEGFATVYFYHKT